MAGAANFGAAAGSSSHTPLKVKFAPQPSQQPPQPPQPPQQQMAAPPPPQLVGGPSQAAPPPPRPNNPTKIKLVMPPKQPPQQQPQQQPPPQQMMAAPPPPQAQTATMTPVDPAVVAKAQQEVQHYDLEIAKFRKIAAQMTDMNHKNRILGKVQELQQAREQALRRMRGL